MRRPFILACVLLALWLAGCASVPTAAPATTPVPLAPTTLASAASTASTASPGPQATALPAAGPTAATLPPPTVPGPANATPPPAATAALAHSWGTWDAYTATLRPAAQQGLDLRDLTQYHIALDLAGDFKTLRGQQQVYYTNRTPVALDSVYFHLYPNLWQGGMTVDRVQVNGQPTTWTTQSGASLLKVALPASLAPGQAAELAMDFTVPIPSGTNSENFGELAYAGGVLALAQAYPTVVVYGDQGWHLETPSETGDVLFNNASLYDVTFTAPADLQVVPTGAILGRTPQPDGRATWRIAGGPMRDFNIVASAQYQQASEQVGDTRIYSHYLPEHAAGGKSALDWAVKAFKTYEQDFGPYPYRELHVAETPTTAGGIEYPGMVVVASSLYANPARGDFFEAATVHEVAHQWWYNVVGNDQVNDPWLDEALAQYSTYLYYDAAYGPPGAQGFKQSLDARWQRVNNEDKPIGLPVADYTSQEYGAIVYGRGPLFLLALEDKIGRPAMLKFLQEYYRKYAWGIATPAGFQALAQEVSGQDLSDLFNSWVYPKK